MRGFVDPATTKSVTKLPVRKKRVKRPVNKQLGNPTEGKLTKKMRTFISRLNSDFGFDPIKEMLDNYRDQVGVAAHVEENIKEKLRMQVEVSPWERSFYLQLKSNQTDILKSLFKYCYPVHRAIESDLQNSRPVQINLNLGGDPGGISLHQDEPPIDI